MRHLLYHITPMGCWRDNLKKLNEYIHVFTGVRLAVVAQGEGLEPLRDIESELSEFDHIWPMQNDPELRETSSLVFLLGALNRYASKTEGITFFAHTKGVTRGDNPAVRLWTELSYEKNLGDIKAVDRALETHAVAGCFRRHGKFQVLGPACDWHYSGTFFWFSNLRLYQKPWLAAIQRTRYGAEAFPGILFKLEESFCLYADNCDSCYRMNNLMALV